MPTAAPPQGAGASLLGRVIDPFGQPLDGLPLPSGGLAPVWRTGDAGRWPEPPALLPHGPEAQGGTHVIEALLALRRGQRVGLVSPNPVAHRTMLAMVSRHAVCDACVIAVVGEYARVACGFLDETLSPPAKARSVVVLSTADQPAIVRARAADTATEIAEAWRAAGRHVLLLVDSLSRYVMARREIELASGRPLSMRSRAVTVHEAVNILCVRPVAAPQPPADRGSVTAVYGAPNRGEDADGSISRALRGVLERRFVLG